MRDKTAFITGREKHFTVIRMQNNNLNKSQAAGMTISLDCMQSFSKVIAEPEFEEPEKHCLH